MKFNKYKKYICTFIFFFCLFIGFGNVKATNRYECTYKIGNEDTTVGIEGMSDEVRDFFYDMIRPDHTGDTVQKNDVITYFRLRYYKNENSDADTNKQDLDLAITGYFPNMVGIGLTDEQKHLSKNYSTSIDAGYECYGVIVLEANYYFDHDYATAPGGAPVDRGKEKRWIEITDTMSIEEVKKNISYVSTLLANTQFNKIKSFDGKNYAAGKVGGYSFRIVFILDKVQQQLDTYETFDACTNSGLARSYGIDSELMKSVNQILNKNSAIIKTFDAVDDNKDNATADAGSIANKYFSSSPYYQCRTKDSSQIHDEMQKDLQVLNTFETSVRNCLSENNPTNDVSIDEILEANFTNITTDFSYRAFKALKVFLDFSEENIKIVCDKKNEDDDKSSSIGEIANDCYNNSLTEDQRKACFEGKYKDYINEMDCDEFSTADYYDENLSPTIKLLMNYSNCDYDDQVCLKRYCEKIKTNERYVEDIVDTIINNDSTKQQEYNNIMSVTYRHLVEITGIVTKEGVCTILKNEMGDYIRGALNLIMIAGIAITVALTTMDAMKSFANGKDDENKKFFAHLKTRLIAIALLVVVPIVIKWVLGFVVNGVCTID